MDADKLEWRYVKCPREKVVDASKWREFMFVTADMREATVRVLVPVGEPATKRLANSDGMGIG